MLRHAIRISATLTVALIMLPASVAWADPATTSWEAKFRAIPKPDNIKENMR